MAEVDLRFGTCDDDDRSVRLAYRTLRVQQCIGVIGPIHSLPVTRNDGTELLEDDGIIGNVESYPPSVRVGKRLVLLR